MYTYTTRMEFMKILYAAEHLYSAPGNYNVLDASGTGALA